MMAVWKGLRSAAQRAVTSEARKVVKKVFLKAEMLVQTMVVQMVAMWEG